MPYVSRRRRHRDDSLWKFGCVGFLLIFAVTGFIDLFSCVGVAPVVRIVSPDAETLPAVIERGSRFFEGFVVGLGMFSLAWICRSLTR